MSSQIGYGDLANLIGDALPAHKTVGEIFLASRRVVGACFSNEHASHDNQKY